MKTRLLVSAVTVAALSLASVSSFAQEYRPSYDHRGDGQPYVQRGGDWQGGRESREHERREHERREHAWGGYVQQPGYIYQQPGYVYQPGYGYDPGYTWQPGGYGYPLPVPQYYGEQYVQPDAAGDAAFGAIVGGVIGAAIAANH